MTNTQLIGGMGAAIGCDFVPLKNRLLFVEYTGKLSRFDLAPTMTIVSQGTAVLKGTFQFDLDAGIEATTGPLPGADIFWEQETTTLRQMVPQSGATLVNIGVTPFASVQPQALIGLAYGSTPISGNNDPSNKLVTNDVFAVKTSSGNYAKVLVTSYGYNMGIQWVTYKPAAAYAVLGTGYAELEDVAASSDGVHAYVIERAGNLLRVPLANANRVNATVVSSGMTAPQQMVLDEPHGHAFVVEYAASGRLLQINLANGAQTVLLSGLNSAVGLAMSADGQTAYVGEQGSGTVSSFALPGGAKTVLATGLTAPFFLTWADGTESTLYVTERDPANAVVAISATLPATKTVVATGLNFRPSCVAVVHPGLLLVTTDQTLEEVTLGSALNAGGPLVAGIGLVPFNFIVGGRATTSTIPGYPFQVTNAPFAGSLPVMVNFLEAIAVGAAYYQVIVDGLVRTDQYNTVYAANGIDYTPKTFQTQTIGGQAYYKVPTIAELQLWYPGLVGCYLDSTTLPNAANSAIVVEFFGPTLVPLVFAPPTAPAVMTIFVDNSPAKAGISQPVLNGVSATTDCGFLKYTAASKATDKVSIAYTASQPQGDATYSFNVIRGISSVPGAAVGGALPAASPYQDTVADLLGTCTIAGFAANVYVAASATTGWGRASWLDASAEVAFVLAPG